MEEKATHCTPIQRDLNAAHKGTQAVRCLYPCTHKYFNDEEKGTQAV